MQLVLDTRGIVMKKRNGCFYLKTEAKERLISPVKVSSIAITSECTLSTAAIRLAIEHRIPIYIIDALGRVLGQFWSASFGHLSTLRRKQVLFADTSAATDWIVDAYRLKIQQQAENLIWLSKHPDIMSKKHPDIDGMSKSIEKLDECQGKPMKKVENAIRGYEAVAAKTYWQTVGQLLPEPMNFSKRSQHPAEDPFNALLNYTYGMLYTNIETSVFSAGLDPHLGVFHADQYNKPTLVFDLIEPFRPWADRFLFGLILENELAKSYFDESDKGVVLAKRGKHLLIPAYNQWLKTFQMRQNQSLSVKNHLAKYVYELVKIIENQD